MQLRKLKRDQVVQVECKDLVPEGFGLVHIEFDGAADSIKPLTGFTWGMLPGESGLARVARVKKNHFHAVLMQADQLGDDYLGDKKKEQLLDSRWALFKQSSLRQPERCANFTLCGGCKLQHLDYQQSVLQKKKWLLTHLEHHQVAHGDVEVVESPRIDHYRNHVQVHINKHKQRGFYAPFSYRTVEFPSHGCLIFDQQAFDREFPVEFELERCIRSRHDYVEQGIGHWSLYSKEDKQAEFTYHIEYPPEKKVAITIPNTSFFQVNTSILPAWLQKIKAMVKDYARGPRCLELFSGFGFISLMLSSQSDIEATGVDILRPGDLLKTKVHSDDARLSAGLEQQRAGFNQRYLQADLTNQEKILGVKEQLSQQFDFILMNPPRSGFGQCDFFFTEVFQGRPPLVYSSCNSATFSRDAAVLQQHGYRLRQIYLFDFFPFTAHFEVLAVFTA